VELKVQKECLKIEKKELQKQAKELKKSANTLKGKKPKNCAKKGSCLKRTTFELPSSDVVHGRVTCDGCGVHPMRGIRYKCTICHDFDYCEKCEATVKHPHAFIKIDHPSKAPQFLFAVDAQPEYTNDISVSGGNPSHQGLGALLHGVAPVLNQFLNPEDLKEQITKLMAQHQQPVEPVAKVEETSEEKVTEKVEQPEEKVTEKVEQPEIEMKREVEVKDPMVERVKLFQEMFGDHIELRNLEEFLKANQFKTDEEIIEMLLARN